MLVVLATVSSFGAAFAVTATPEQILEFVQTIPAVLSLATISYLMALALTRGRRAAARERETSAASLALARARTIEELEATALRSAAVLLGEPRDAVIRLHLHPDATVPHPVSPGDGAAGPGSVGSHRLLLPVTGRAGILATLVVDTGRAQVPAESRDALEVLTNSLGLSLTALRLYEDTRLRAERDALTGLANRDVLHSRLATAVANSGDLGATTGALAVLVVDLDGFKQINDTHGHAAGDAVLRTTAARLRAAVRPGDVVARLGGDEFVVLLLPAGAEPIPAGPIVERFRRAMAEPMTLAGGVRVQVSASLGLASVAAGESGDDLLHRADIAMYVAKRARPALPVPPRSPSDDAVVA